MNCCNTYKIFPRDFSVFDKEFMQKVQSQNFEEFLEVWLPKRTSWGKPVPNNKIVVFSNVINLILRTHITKLR
jgi:hypothetical protein